MSSPDDDIPPDAFDSVGLATEPVYTTPEPDTSVELYGGLITLGEGKKQIQGKGKVCLYWTPKPHIGFEVNFERRPGDALRPAPDFPVHLDDLGITIPAEVSTYEFRDGGRARGRVEDGFRLGDDVEARRVLFHVTNFPPITAKFIHLNFPNGRMRCSWPGRTILEADGWKITLDAVEGSDRLKRRVAEVGGHAITHVALVERTDGRGIRPAEAEDFSNLLDHFLSFARGAWTSLQLAVGLDDAGNRLWRIWDTGRTTPGYALRSWLYDLFPGGLPGLFRTYAARWCDPLWRNPLSQATLHYVEAMVAPSGMEISSANTQMGIELLAWMWAVEHKKAVSRTRFDKRMNAAARIRWMVKDCGLDAAIPQSLKKLTHLAKAEGWEDGPDAITKIRNKLEHPKRDNIEALHAMPKNARSQAWALGLQYLDLAFLRVLEYQGNYSNKVYWGPEPVFLPRVPWMTPAKPASSSA